MLQRFILGTAGHIDHGKSSLVRALTGTDPDRLKEEKERGITIELGFAQLGLPDAELGIVDVPGHERFVRAMVAGATGIDFVLLVVAADEGVMPQTREHLDICTLLGVQKGVVALTKTDLVEDEDWLGLVELDVQEALEGTFLEEAEIVPVSAQTGAGLEELKQALSRCAHAVEEKTRKDQPRLAIDRVFEVKGFGAVVTGTLLSGRLAVEDRVMVLPENLPARVRGLQVHKQTVTEAFAGQRTAVNLQGVELSSLHRGQVLIKGELEPTSEFDAEIRLLSHLPKPLKHRSPLLFHAGTVQIPARLWLYTDSHLHPGQEGYARILLEEPTLLMPGDSFILRGFQRFEGNGTTVGGGAVLDPFPPRRKRRSANYDRLDALAGEDRGEALALLVREAGVRGVTQPSLEQRLPGRWKEYQKLLSGLLSQGVLGQFEKSPPTFLHRDTLDELATEALRRLTEYHERLPLEEGMSREELREGLGIEQPKLYAFLLRRMEQAKQVVVEKEWVRLQSHQVHLKAAAAAAETYLLESYQNGGLAPPRVKELMEDLGMVRKELKAVLKLLMRRGELCKVTDELYFSTGVVEELRQTLVAFLKEHGEVTPQQFKQMTGASRKFTIPLAEYFDLQQVTRRVGDVRILRKTE